MRDGTPWVKHGLSRTRAAVAWYAMHRRCNATDGPYWELYGSRGICVCERWMSLSAFVEDMGQPDAGMTLERLNTNCGYSLANCIWADRRTQNRNSRRSMRWLVSGKSFETAREAAAACGVAESTVRRWCGVIPSSARRSDCSASLVYAQPLDWIPLPVTTKDAEVSNG